MTKNLTSDDLTALTHIFRGMFDSEQKRLTEVAEQAAKYHARKEMEEVLSTEVYRAVRKVVKELVEVRVSVKAEKV